MFMSAAGSVMHFILYLTVWGVEPVVTHQTSWLKAQVYAVSHTGFMAVHDSFLAQPQE